MTTMWDPNTVGLLRLPSGRCVRGRGLRRPFPGDPPPSFAVYLTHREPPATGWESRWIRWPDFWLPSDPDELRDALQEARIRSETERVEIACSGGYGRTGTALACLAVLDGIAAGDAVEFVREHYTRRAVEMPWQRRFVARFR
ncbi:protein phosphatase [Rhodococcus sp. ABRD24]|uniref:protein-tyrosine phosphatase family protein n=1 Tax=Rhodococcus sp. ABRD24 TaxID=2507582 RepID=UPI00103FE035|nr:protein-tyrosine phosphatase family protein [Rhodococcus sp. ABRD24]QBJ95088.1 protein phosphatase [Rhodococcus sp. ABRD24]